MYVYVGLHAFQNSWDGLYCVAFRSRLPFTFWEWVVLSYFRFKTLGTLYIQAQTFDLFLKTVGRRPPICVNRAFHFLSPNIALNQLVSTHLLTQTQSPSSV